MLVEESSPQGRNRCARRALVGGAGHWAIRRDCYSRIGWLTRRQKPPSAGATITKFYVAEAGPESGYETSPLHIIYSDGTDIVEELPPLKKGTERDAVFNSVGFSDAQLADDRQTLGWTVLVENCCTSYSIPLSVELFRSGRILHSISRQIVWRWMFLGGGKQVAVVWGPRHGPEVGNYRLYDPRAEHFFLKLGATRARRH